MQLLPCRHCRRKFNPKAHARHVKICAKQKNSRKPKVKTAAEKRMEALAEMNPGVNVRELKSKAVKNKRAAKRKNARGSKGGKWRQQSNALREAMQASRSYDKQKAMGVQMTSEVSADQHRGLTPW